MTTREDIMRVARSYVGTPFAHLGRLPGLEIDCAGVLVCIMRELSIPSRTDGVLASNFDVPPYTPTPDGESMLALCDKHLVRIAAKAVRPGDAVCLITDHEPQHLGILANHPRFDCLSLIHASNSPSVVPARVIEHRLLLSRACRLAAAYSFAGVE